MPRRSSPIARIRLARSWPRLLAVPALLVAVGVAIAVAGMLIVEGPARYLVVATGAIPALAGAYLGIRIATMRAEVEEAAVRVSWLGGGRSYALVPGPVTRVRLRGDLASALRARSGILGWQLGAATLRGEEAIEVVRLARTRTAILVPTDRGRLAIAAASEPQLLEALSRAAHARKRLEDLVGTQPSETLDADADPSAHTATGEHPTPTLPIETPPHILTGIERAMLDERLGQERLALEGAARAQAEAEAAARAEAERAAAALAAAESAAAEIDLEGDVAELEEPPRVPSVGFVLLPLAATLAMWGAALALERLPAPGSDAGRLTALALVFAGPATSIAAIMARAWWPRLVGVVVTSGLAAAVFVGRAIFGS